LHPRLNAVATSNLNGRDHGGDINIVSIIAVPRGSLVDPKTGMISTLDGTVVVEPPTITPYDGTPALSDQREMPAPIEPPERLPVVELDVSNVTPLRRRSGDEDDGPDGAA
jgi:hypothetical protein